MSVQNQKVTLSRFFNNNVQLVAKICPKCYDETTDVKILSINLPFLKQVSNNFQDVDTKMLSTIFESNWCEMKTGGSEDDCFGFTQGQIDESIQCSEKLKEILNKELDVIIKLEEAHNKEDKNSNMNAEDFLGFSSDEIETSKENYNKFETFSKLVRYKIYRRVRLGVVKNNYASKKNVHRKFTRRKSSEEKESKYFKQVPKIEENRSKYFSTNCSNIKIKKEEIDLKLEKCQHVKSEPIQTENDNIDYESVYFKITKPDQVVVGPEPHLVKKEGFEDTIPEDKPTIWVPPKSPHNLIEEVLHHDPWALLVATIFLNRTSCMCARPYVFWFLSENPDPFKVLQKFPQELEKYFVKLGLQKTRAVQVWRMSHDFIHKNWSNVKELYGIGRYGEDAYRMFCQGDFSVTPRDRFLRIYKAWYEKILISGGCGVANKN